MSFPTGWGRSSEVTLITNRINKTFNYFPIQLGKSDLPEEMYKSDSGYSAIEFGGDIRFSLDSSGTYQLPCDITTFHIDSNISKSIVDIKTILPIIFVTAQTKFYVWYNKSGEVQPPENSPYGRLAVYSNYYKVNRIKKTSSQVYFDGSSWILEVYNKDKLIYQDKAQTAFEATSIINKI